MIWINDILYSFIGFPPEFVNAFKNGFPHNWLSLVADFFNSESRLVINLFNQLNILMKCK